MLGNWSLGDYWKEETINWSYEFLTKELSIPQEKLIALGKKDNWWGPVGETGPCGPDTEMFVDVTVKPHSPNCLPGDNCGRFSEVWNDVFMEYNRKLKIKNKQSLRSGELEKL